MMKMVKQFILNAITFLLIASLGGVFYNNLTNGHYHKLENGRKIYHAHPFDKDSETGHSHTNSQFLHLQSVFELFNALPFALGILIVLQATNREFGKDQNFTVYRQFFHTFLNKAPPAHQLT